MKKRLNFHTAVCCVACWLTIQFFSSCANMVPPTGGPRDSLPPMLVAATPADSAVRVNTNRITLTFNEFVELADVQRNLIVQPNPFNQPIVQGRLRTVTVRLRDSLLPNTTYSIQFGNAIKDVNEGNVAPNFTYVFSTGPTIDENIIEGKVQLARTGGIDTTLIVVLHRNLHDSAILKNRPLYYTRLNGRGEFRFEHLPAGRFAVYAVPDDFTRRYDDSTKLFAFLDSAVSSSPDPRPLALYAYQQAEKNTATPRPSGNIGRQGTTADNRLRFTTNLEGTSKDLLTPLRLQFNRPLKQADTSLLALTDTAFIPRRPVRFELDSSRTTLSVYHSWAESTPYRLLVPAQSVADTAGRTLSKADTLRFTTQSESQYGSVRLRFKNPDLSRRPVMQILENDRVVDSFPIAAGEWYRRLYPPGQYTLKILYDRNGNGTWDPGSFPVDKRQPEIVVDLRRTLNVRANWDNEFDINF